MSTTTTSFLHPSHPLAQSRPLTTATTTTGTSTHFHSLLNTTSSISTHAPLNLSGLMGRIKNPQDLPHLHSTQPRQSNEMQEVLLPPSNNNANARARGSTQDERRGMKYVPSPTLSYYANFIPVTPAPAPGSGSVPPQLPRQTSSTSTSTFTSTSTTTSTSFSEHRNDPTSSSNTSHPSATKRIKRKPPPAPLSLYRVPSSGVLGRGQVGGQVGGQGRARGQLGVGRALPTIILLDSPLEDQDQGDHQDVLAGVPRIRVDNEEDDRTDRLRPAVPEGSGEEAIVVQGAAGGVGGNLLKSLFRSKSRPCKNTRSDAQSQPEPSPDWVEVEQGYRHPSGAFGLDVGDMNSASPSASALNLNLAEIDLLQPVLNQSPQDPMSSPGTGGVLHNILLTPTYSTGTYLTSSARQRTPSPRAHINNAHSSTLNLLPHGSSSRAQSPNKMEKRKTLLDKAGRMFNDRRMRLVHDQHGRGKEDGLMKPGPDRGVKVGGIVPSSLTGFHNKGNRPTTSESDLYALDFLKMQKPGSFARTESYGGSVDGGKGRYGMDSVRDGSGWQDQGRGGSGTGYEKDRRGRSMGDRDALLRKQRRKKLWILAALVLLVIASAVIGLCAGLLTRKSSSSESTESDDNRDATLTSASPSTSASSAAPTSSTYTLSTCLSLFALSAPSAPTAYPCDQCLPMLNTGENDYLASANDGTGPSGNSTGVGAAVQFCALQSIFANTQGTGKRRKRAGVLDGWMGNTNPCSGWSGVTCDGKARVRSLSLVYPGVPNALDESIGGLVGLESIKIVGNSVLPAGPIPNSIFSSTLKTIEIQSTGLASLGANAFASLSTLTSLVLVSNAKLGSTLPALPQTLELSTISVTGQSLTTDPFPALPASLIYIDLSFNALSGSMPSLSKFTGLQSLFLDSNNYVSMAGDIPTSLQDLSIQSNPSLGGLLPATLCSSTSLKTCELQGTNLGSANAQNTTTTQVGAIATRVVNATATSTIMTTATAISTTAPRCGICRF